MFSFLFCAAVLLNLAAVGSTIPLDNFYPFGLDSGDSSLPPNDDESSLPIELTTQFPYFNTRQTSIFVNNNGVLSFGRRVEQFTPDSFPLGDGRRIIAPFWGDVDTFGTGTVWFRESADPSLLTRARNDIRSAFVNQMSYEPTFMFIATWDHVGYFQAHTDLTNTFQCILVTNGRRSFVIFLYADGLIQWTTGDASGGFGGFGGTPAQVGFNAGDGVRFANVSSSQTAEIINIASTSNVDRPGVWIFRVDQEEIVVMQECRNDPSVPLIIGPRFGSLLGGTAVHISGPCFDQSDVTKCTFDGEDVDGIVLNNLTAMCVSPAFKDVKWNEVSVDVISDGVITYSGKGEFYSVNPEDIVDITIDQDPLLLVRGSDDMYTAHWDPQSLLPLLDPSMFTVNIELYRLDIDKQEWLPFLKIASDHPNSGTLEFSAPSTEEDEAEVYPVSLRISVGQLVSSPVGAQGGVSQPIKDVIKFVNDAVSQWMSNLYYAVSMRLLENCLAWHRSEPEEIGQQIAARVLPCCETEEKARAPNSGFVRDTHDSLVAFFHPGAANCYRQATIIPENLESGQQCCYDSSEFLITGPLSGGSVDRVAPVGRLGFNIIRHLMVDVIPAIYCCKGIYRDNTCTLYYERRPSGTGETCDPPVPAFTFGDPHIVTLDGFQYTFNGLGEFVLIQTVDDDFTLQGRMIQAKDDNDNFISATAFSAIIAKQFNSDTVQFQLVESEIIFDEVEALVNGELLDFEGIPKQLFNNVTVEKTPNAVSAIFSTGVRVEAKAENGIISVLSVSMPRSYMSVTSGLMGNYNGDTADDLLPRGGAVPISIDSDVKDIHEQFGITWIINNSNDSLFTYAEGESWSDYYKPEFLPFFEPVFSDPALEQQANLICGDDDFCRYDIAATGRTSVGMATLQGNIELERIVNISVPVVCDPPCQNGVCIQNDTCSCSEGYTGERCDEAVEMECEENLCENGGTCTVVASSTICTCPEEYTGVLCQESTIECPPLCTRDYCSAKATRRSLCTIPSPVSNSACRSPCRITYCHTCYYSDEIRPLPEHCNTCPSYPDLDQAGDSGCFKQWAICIRRSINPTSPRRRDEKTQERFKCFEHPCL